MLNRIVILLLLLLPLPVLSSTGLEAGLAAIEKGNYQQAYQILLPLAKGGNAEAQYQLGEMLVLFPLKEHTASEGLHWLNEAVAQQHYQAAISLSKMYLSGMGVPYDMKKGRHYLELAESFTQAPQDDCD